MSGPTLRTTLLAALVLGAAPALAQSALAQGAPASVPPAASLGYAASPLGGQGFVQSPPARAAARAPRIAAPFEADVTGSIADPRPRLRGGVR
ncbi:hypothetical protein [Methylobacterium sp. A54F]